MNAFSSFCAERAVKLAIVVLPIAETDARPLEHVHVPVLDLYALKPDRRITEPDNNHYSEFGSQYLADRIAPFVLEHLR